MLTCSTQTQFRVCFSFYLHSPCHTVIVYLVRFYLHFSFPFPSLYFHVYCAFFFFLSVRMRPSASAVLERSWFTVSQSLYIYITCHTLYAHMCYQRGGGGEGGANKCWIVTKNITCSQTSPAVLNGSAMKSFTLTSYVCVPLMVLFHPNVLCALIQLLSLCMCRFYSLWYNWQASKVE